MDVTDRLALHVSGSRPDRSREDPAPRIPGGHGPAVPSGRLDAMRLSRLIVPALVLAVAGCTSSANPGTASSPGSATAPAATQSPPSPGAWDWPNYHRDPAHTGSAAAPPAGQLSIAWTRRLDGAVYGQPLVIGGLVIAATEGDSIYGLDRATGQVRWRRRSAAVNSRFCPARPAVARVAGRAGRSIPFVQVTSYARSLVVSRDAAIRAGPGRMRGEVEETG